MLKKDIIFLTIILFLLLLTVFWGCDDNPVTPKIDELKDYIIYMFETDHAGGHYYMGYHPVSGVIDTFTAEDSPYWTMKVSADGKYMFVATRDYVAKVDLQTKSTIATLSYRADNGIVVSPDNELLAISMGPGVAIVRVSDFSVVYEDLLFKVKCECFSSDSKKIFGRVYETYSTVAIVDIENNYYITEKALPTGPIRKFIPSLDESKYFLIWQYDLWFNLFGVYDIELDSIIFRDGLWGGYTDLKVSTDGKYVFYTEAGNETDISGANYFTTYDVNRNRVKMKVSTVGVEDGINPEFMPLGTICVIPDGKWLVIGAALNGSSFIRFNISTMEIDEYIKGESSESYRNYTCQINQ